MEEWRPINDFPNYEVSNMGRVQSVPHITTATHTNKNGVVVVKQQNRAGIILSTKIERHGYVTVTLMKDGKPVTKTPHRLVAEAFLPNPDNKAQVDHIDRNKKNNVVTNLRWATRCENQQNREYHPDMYLSCVWKITFQRDGRQVQRTFRTEAEARAFRLAEVGF